MYKKILYWLVGIFIALTAISELTSSAGNILQAAGPCITGEYETTYSMAQVERMMSYHGALVARFDGHKWFFLKGDRWIPLENAGAREYAMSVHGTGPNSL